MSVCGQHACPASVALLCKARVRVAALILEEIAMYDDQPPYGAFERSLELFFGEHPLSTRV